MGKPWEVPCEKAVRMATEGLAAISHGVAIGRPCEKARLPGWLAWQGWLAGLAGWLAAWQGWLAWLAWQGWLAGRPESLPTVVTTVSRRFHDGFTNLKSLAGRLHYYLCGSA